MKIMKSMKALIVLAAMAVTLTGCTDYRTIPASKVGIVIDKSGVSEDILTAGNYDIGYQRRITKTLILLDTSIEIIPLELKLRLADDQELGIQILVKTRIKTSDKQTLKAMFGMITPDATRHEYTKNITLTKVYTKLGQDLVRRSAMEVLSPHTLESFRKERKEINDVLETLIASRFDNTPLNLLSATINDVKYPEKYMKSADEIKEKEMSKALKVAVEDAKRAALLEEEKTIIIDQRVRLSKAETIRLENLKTSTGLNPMLLEYRKLELEEKRLLVDMAMADAAAVNGNSTIFYPTNQKPDYMETTLSRK